MGRAVAESGTLFEQFGDSSVGANVVVGVSVRVLTSEIKLDLLDAGTRVGHLRSSFESDNDFSVRTSRSVKTSAEVLADVAE